MTAYLALLRNNPGYTRLWLAQAISLAGDWFNRIALFALVSQYSGGSGVAVSLLILAQFLPPLLVGPYAGVLVDRLNRKHLMIASDVLRAVTVVGYLFAQNAQTLWVIYLLTVIQFILSAVFEPARSAIMPSLVDQDSLVRANTLGSVTWSVMLAAGAAIGGVTASIFGTNTALIIDAFSFILSALIVASIASSGRPQQNSQTHQKTSGFRDGLRYVRSHPSTAAVLLVKLGGSVGSIDALLVIYATHIFVLGQDGTGSLGILYAAFGLGAVLGPAFLNRFHRGSVYRMRRLIVVGYTLITVGWLLFGGAPSLILAAVALSVKAMGSSVYWTYSSVILQKTVPDAFLGRVFSLDMAGFQLMTVISVVITGALIDQFGQNSVRVIVFGTGVASLIPLALWAIAQPWIDRQEKVGEMLTASPSAD